MKRAGVTGALLEQRQLDDYRPLGAFGQPVYLSFSQLRAAVLARLGATCANFFAVPHLDPDSREMSWHAHLTGVPTRWSALEPNAQARLALELETIRASLHGYVAELRQQAGGNGIAYADLIEQAIRIPSDDNLYVVGGKPVAAFWGFSNGEGVSIDALAIRPVSPRISLREPAAATAVIQESVPLSTVLPASAPTPSEPPAPRRRWLWWALTGLLLLLLLWLFLFRSSEQAGPVVAPPDEQPVTPAAPVLPAVTQPPAGAEAAVGVAPPTPDHRRGPIAGTGVTPGAPLPPMVRGSLPGDPPIAPEANPAGNGEAAPSTEPAGGVALPSPSLEPALPPLAGEAGERAVPVHPPERSADKAEEAPGGVPGAPGLPAGPGELSKPSKPAGQPDAPAVPPGPAAAAPGSRPAGSPLEVPADANPASRPSFLEGKWQGGEPLWEPGRKQMYDLSLDFDREGKGEVTYRRRSDGVVCRSPVQGNMMNGQLQIRGTAPVRCPDGVVLPAPMIDCTRSSGAETRCQGRDPGGPPYDVEISRPR